MSKELKVAQNVFTKNGFSCARQNVTSSVWRFSGTNLHTSETINAKGWHAERREGKEGDGENSRTIGFREARESRIRSAEYVAGEIRQRIRTVVHLSAVERALASGCSLPSFLSAVRVAANPSPFAVWPRDTRHFSARFNLRKMPATATYPYPFVRICLGCLWPVRESFGAPVLSELMFFFFFQQHAPQKSSRTSKTTRSLVVV